ncbi:MAG: sulfite exporter TauE/SafE family protein [Polaromonas sp.]|uniref:sulfite exporter TauE/SafE family protein n=1 Tax=Polaromonas sp. TaxID=1869339 RepID=UPI0027304035|nr:sulfite exporter TauE/SafE family protein [Polaromonas sp.]MDP1743038.1 sulfite exporter TauE/SafE family protein [Polaromonas sp.]MDP1954401.1 sulfite exporter TauE/SafE family protein [Polaromonas sp.]MDP3356313.1 sulfite exporter TauE/SafE family protein [Polaromonas sp.]
MTFPLITDPFFYAVAVPAVILMGVSKSGFGAGFGSLAVPLMALAVTVPQAAAILMPILLLIDILGMAAFRKNFDMRLVKFLLPFGLLGTLVGTLLFSIMPANVVAGLVGAFTLLFLAQRLVFPPRPDSPPPPRWLGALLAVTSGFTSFISHAGGPPISAYVIPLRLAPLTFTASLAFFFFVINLSKWIPYGLLGLLDLRNMATSLVLLPLAPLGVWVGVRLARRIDPALFYRILYVGMFLTGIKLLWDGLR